MKLLKPDATTDGKIIFNFEVAGEIITIIKEVADLKKATLVAAKNAAITEAKIKDKEMIDKKNKRMTTLTALESAGIVAEDIA